MKNIRTTIDEMIKTATDLNVHSIDYSKGNIILISDYYHLRHIVKDAYYECDWDTQDLQNNKFSKIFDILINDDYLSYGGLSKFISLLADIDVCYAMANFVNVIIPHFENIDDESNNEEGDEWWDW